MDYSKYNINTITRGACEIFLAKHHHLSKQGNTFRSGQYFGLVHEDTLVAVAVFNTMSSQVTAKGCFGLDNNDQTGFFEIGRFAIDPDHDTNGCAAWFLKECIRRFCDVNKARALFAYVDPAYETGEVYIEAGFTCYGLTAKRTDFYAQQEDGSYIKKNRGQTKNCKGEWRARSQKLRFLLVRDSTLHTKWKNNN